ncbi:MAG: cytochrome-c oxidase [Deltaproteobacteria bacterium HGW-Deltaproteobacteria-13]|jgi:cytochrome c oxidase subunit 2|nr:MAG: cytochrome-c oxidase [Deltaproteobacteria bacterium HGW-Deltaproteobacteria-13]
MKTAWFKLAIHGLLAVFILASIGPYSGAAEKGQVISIKAKKFEFMPNEITLKKGVPVVLEFTSLDRMHGFHCPGLGIRTDILPKKVTRLQLVPDKTGTFPFHCDIFCGSGHEEMGGKIIVTD